MPEDACPATGPVVRLRRLDPGLPLPSYANPFDAGLDLMARQDALLVGGGRVVVDTGVAVALPAGHVGFVTPRSGLAARHGITVLNGPGTVDAGYRGELRVVLHNTSTEDVQLRRGDRIAQLVVQRVEHAQLVEVDELDESVRGTGGFGSTGGVSAGLAQPAAGRPQTTDNPTSRSVHAGRGAENP